MIEEGMLDCSSDCGVSCLKIGLFCLKVNISKRNFDVFWNGILPSQQKLGLLLQNKVYW